MYLTEKEAKDKWCPEIYKGHEGGTCLASDCMMWRRKYDCVDGEVGYCGLASKPESIYDD